MRTFSLTVFLLTTILLMSLAELTIAESSTSKSNVGVFSGEVRQFHPDFATTLGDAAPDQIFAAKLKLKDGTSVSQVESVARQYQVPRILAYVYYELTQGGKHRNMKLVGLGEMYDTADARRFTRCQALISVSIGPHNSLRDQEIDEWPVSEVHVYADTITMRKIINGGLLPVDRIMEGVPQPSDSIDKVAKYTRQQVADGIRLPANLSLPDECTELVKPAEGPIIDVMQNPKFNTQFSGTSTQWRERALGHLETLPADSLVNLTFKLIDAMNLDDLGELVNSYQIPGLRAEFDSRGGLTHMIAEAQLSIYGEPLARQKQRTECQMRTGEHSGKNSGWQLSWVLVSVPHETAIDIVEQLYFSRLTVNGAVPRTETERLKKYYEDRSITQYEDYGADFVPEVCKQFY